jgi:ParB-like chromosome segregation protein Spo0J
MIIEKKKISELKPAAYNPRQSTEKQEADLKASLDKFGLVEPIVFNKQTNNVVGGHFRIRELQKLGKKEVDCVIVDLSLEDEKELNIRLNANNGQWDWDKLANEWDSELLQDWGLDNMNFEQDDIDEVSEINEECQFIIQCTNIDELETLKHKLKTTGKKMQYSNFVKLL